MSKKRKTDLTAKKNREKQLNDVSYKLSIQEIKLFLHIHRCLAVQSKLYIFSRDGYDHRTPISFHQTRTSNSSCPFLTLCHSSVLEIKRIALQPDGKQDSQTILIIRGLSKLHSGVSRVIGRSLDFNTVRQSITFIFVIIKRFF